VTGNTSPKRADDSAYTFRKMSPRRDHVGSLGHGFGIATGIALGARMSRELYMTFALLGDGELYEGAVWETALFAAHNRLNNLVAIIDRKPALRDRFHGEHCPTGTASTRSGPRSDGTCAASMAIRWRRCWIAMGDVRCRPFRAAPSRHRGYGQRFMALMLCRTCRCGMAWRPRDPTQISSVRN